MRASQGGAKVRAIGEVIENHFWNHKINLLPISIPFLI